MVDQNYIFRIVYELEYYLIRLNQFLFNGRGYELVLFVPILRKNEVIKYNVILSASILDSYSRKDIISDIYSWLDSRVNKESLDRIESVIITNSNSPFVKNMRFTIPIIDDIMELNDYEVGGVKIHHGFLITANIANKLIIGNALIVKLNNGDTINMGIKAIKEEEDIMIEYYTGKGLRELFPRNNKKEDLEKAKSTLEKGDSYLHENNYLSYINLSEIRSIK